MSANLPSGLQGAAHAVDGAKLDPQPELPDDTPVDVLDIAPRVQQILVAEGFETIGEVREVADEVLLSFQNFGVGTVSHLRETLGLPSCDGVRRVRELKVRK
jgi:DNA-directed RNA polymerase alpha subunit